MDTVIVVFEDVLEFVKLPSVKAFVERADIELADVLFFKLI